MDNDTEALTRNFTEQPIFTVFNVCWRLKMLKPRQRSQRRQNLNSQTSTWKGPDCHLWCQEYCKSAYHWDCRIIALLLWMQQRRHSKGWESRTPGQCLPALRDRFLRHVSASCICNSSAGFVCDAWLHHLFELSPKALQQKGPKLSPCKQISVLLIELPGLMTIAYDNLGPEKGYRSSNISSFALNCTWHESTRWGLHECPQA